MAKVFKFVGGTTRTKIEWPIEVQAVALSAKHVNGASAKDAFVQALERLNEIRTEESKPLAELPKSYTGKHAGSLMWGLAKRFLTHLKAKSEEHVKWATALGLNDLVVEVEVPDEAESN